MNEWLRKLLEAAAIGEDGKLEIDKLMGQINAEFPKNAVPKETFNDVNGQLKTANKTITELKTTNEDNLELQKKITEHETAMENQKADYEAQVKQLQIDSAVQKALFSAGAKNQKAAMALLDFDKLELQEDGQLKGLDDQVKTLAESEDSSFLFKQEEKPKNPYKPKDGSGQTSSNALEIASHRNDAESSTPPGLWG